MEDDKKDATSGNEFVSVPDEGKVVMSGLLAEVDLFSATQFLMIQRKTGVLLVRGEKKGTAKLAFDDGQIVDAEDNRGDEPEDAALRMFKWKKGGFVFYSVSAIPRKRISKDTQSLLLEIAVKIDEEAAQAAADESRGVPEEPPKIAVAQLVRPAQPGEDIPQHVPRPLTETQLIRSVQEKLVIYDEDLPDKLGRDYRRELGSKRGAETGSRAKAIALVITSVAIVSGVLLVIFSILKAEKDKKSKAAALAARMAAPPKKKEPPPTVVLPYEFTTRPKTPERRVEEVIKDIPLKCLVSSIVIPKGTPSTVTVTYRKEAYWDLDELKSAAAADSALTIKKIFDTLPDIMTIKVNVMAYLELSGDEHKLDSVLFVLANRAEYDPNADPAEPYAFIRPFHHVFCPKLE